MHSLRPSPLPLVSPVLDLCRQIRIKGATIGEEEAEQSRLRAVGEKRPFAQPAFGSLSLSLPCPIFLCSHTLSLFLPEFDVNMSLPHYGAFFRKTEDISFVLTTFSFPNAFSLLFLPHSPGPAALPLPPPTCPCVACLVAQQCRTILWRAVALPIPRPQT
jgi:hypothetical protein